MKSASEVFGLAVLSFLLAAGILGVFMMGPIGFVSAPVLALFGWFYFPIVLAGHFAVRRIWRETAFPRIPFCLLLATCAALLFCLIGIKEEGKFAQSVAGYFVGAFISGCMSLWFLTSDREEQVEHTDSTTL